MADDPARGGVAIRTMLRGKPGILRTSETKGGAFVFARSAANNASPVSARVEIPLVCIKSETFFFAETPPRLSVSTSVTDSTQDYQKISRTLDFTVVGTGAVDRAGPKPATPEAEAEAARALLRRLEAWCKRRRESIALAMSKPTRDELRWRAAQLCDARTMRLHRALVAPAWAARGAAGGPTAAPPGSAPASVAALSEEEFWAHRQHAGRANHRIKRAQKRPLPTAFVSDARPELTLKRARYTIDEDVQALLFAEHPRLKQDYDRHMERIERAKRERALRASKGGNGVRPPKRSSSQTAASGSGGRAPPSGGHPRGREDAGRLTGSELERAAKAWWVKYFKGQHKRLYWIGEPESGVGAKRLRAAREAARALALAKGSFTTASLVDVHSDWRARPRTDADALVERVDEDAASGPARRRRAAERRAIEKINHHSMTVAKAATREPKVVLAAYRVETAKAEYRAAARAAERAAEEARTAAAAARSAGFFRTQAGGPGPAAAARTDTAGEIPPPAAAQRTRATRMARRAAALAARRSIKRRHAARYADRHRHTVMRAARETAARWIGGRARADAGARALQPPRVPEALPLGIRDGHIVKKALVAARGEAAARSPRGMRRAFAGIRPNPAKAWSRGADDGSGAGDGALRVAQSLGKNATGGGPNGTQPEKSAHEDPKEAAHARRLEAMIKHNAAVLMEVIRHLTGHRSGSHCVPPKRVEASAASVGGRPLHERVEPVLAGVQAALAAEKRAMPVEYRKSLGQLLKPLGDQLNAAYEIWETARTPPPPPPQP
jgi:hypothetical protein